MTQPLNRGKPASTKRRIGSKNTSGEMPKESKIPDGGCAAKAYLFVQLTLSFEP